MPGSVTFPTPSWLLTAMLVLGLVIPGTIDALLSDPPDPAPKAVASSPPATHMDAEPTVEVLVAAPGGSGSSGAGPAAGPRPR